MAALFRVKALRQWRNDSRLASQLFPALQDDFGASLVLLDLASNLNQPSGKLAYVADIFQIVREHHHRERTQPVVFAEIEIAHAAVSCADTDHPPGHALPLTNVFWGLIEWDAFGGGERNNQRGSQNPTGNSHDFILRKRFEATSTNFEGMALFFPKENGTARVERAHHGQAGVLHSQKARDVGRGILRLLGAGPRPHRSPHSRAAEAGSESSHRGPGGQALSGLRRYG